MSEQARRARPARTRTVAVLGAGVGGLCAASRLRSLLPDGDRVVLVDRCFDGVLGLSLPWVLRGWRGPDQVRVSPAPATLPGVDLVTAEAKAVEPERQALVTDAGEIHYDALILAPGAALCPAAVPGLTEALAAGTAGEFYTLEGASHLHEQLRAFASGRIAVVIASIPFRCPAAPYEGALLAADLLRQTGAGDRTRIDVYTPEPLPMPVAGPVVGEALVAMLSQYGIGFHPNTTVESIDPARRQVSWAGGGRGHFDLLIAIPPHRPPDVAANLELSPAGWLPVNARTLATEIEGVWAIGDATQLMLPTGKPLPKAAVFAEAQADVAAAGVARYLGYDAPEPWFSGDGFCFIELGGALAAKGEGNFLAEPAPDISLHEPSPAFHQQKADQESAWLSRWNG
jgi:sulfide:quinone oxidoreductase